jgi:hypothetical protein
MQKPRNPSLDKVV